ncbi:MAG: tyrosine--tRNA ligase [Bacteroidia bacterium]|nr:tyrosine--tRNA ligase [Bacteroidia bacterium]
MSTTNFVEELRWRGMLHDIMPETEELLNKKMVTGYIGFDPTADSLGVGNLVQVMTLLHFQRAGHKPMALVGGATGMVGDPSGKSAERNLLDEATLQHNLAGQRAQLERFLNFDCGANSATIVNNYDWFKNFSFLEFIRDVGKHLTVNYMLSKDSVKNRLENGMSFTEFSYQLVQGYDFYYLWKNSGVQLQMGGSDQWGNIVTGSELIRRKDGGNAYALTTQLIKKADGTKFGKTESGNIWLDASKTSTYQFYQFWLNASDEDAEKFIKIFTLLNRIEIEAIVAQHATAPHLRHLQKTLAKDITTRVHGEVALANAIEASEILFKGDELGLRNLAINDFVSVFEGTPQHSFEIDKLSAELNIIDFLVDTQLFQSKGEARKMVQAGGVSINKTKVDDVEQLVTKEYFIHNKYIVVQKGKKNYYLVTVE